MLHEIALRFCAAAYFDPALGNLDVIAIRQRHDASKLPNGLQFGYAVILSTDLPLGLRTDVADFTDTKMTVEIWNAVSEGDAARRFAKNRFPFEIS